MTTPLELHLAAISHLKTLADLPAIHDQTSSGTGAPRIEIASGGGAVNGINLCAGHEARGITAITVVDLEKKGERASRAAHRIIEHFVINAPLSLGGVAKGSVRAVTFAGTLKEGGELRLPIIIRSQGFATGN